MYELEVGGVHCNCIESAVGSRWSETDCMIKREMCTFMFAPNRHEIRYIYRETPFANPISLLTTGVSHNCCGENIILLPHDFEIVFI